MGLFLSSFTNRIDRKGRVSVPGPFRAALGDEVARGVVLVRSPLYPALEGFGYGMVEEIVARLDEFAMFSAEQDALASAILAQSVLLSLDSEGRISIPPELLDYMGVADSVVFAGLGRKFQVWAPDAWDARRVEAQEKVKVSGLNLPKKHMMRDGA